MNLEGIAFVVMVSVLILTIAAVYGNIYIALLYQYVPSGPTRTPSSSGHSVPSLSQCWSCWW